MLKRKQWLLLALLTVAGLPAVLASVPRAQDFQQNTAIYQNLHEIRVQKIKSLDFDRDIDRLTAQEKKHRAHLPLSLTSVMDRVEKTKYRKTH